MTLITDPKSLHGAQQIVNFNLIFFNMFEGIVANIKSTDWSSLRKDDGWTESINILPKLEIVMQRF